MGLVQQVLEIVKKRNPNEPEFLQAVTEVLESIRPAIQRNKKYQRRKDSRAPGGAGADDSVPRSVDRRQRPDSR